MSDRGSREWVVDDLRPEDREAWAVLHRGYLDFYEVAKPDQVTDTLWRWLLDPGHDLEAVVLRQHHGGEAMGLAHYRPYPRPIHGTTGGFLDDLFVAPEARGTGAVDALLAELQRRARARGWVHLRWVTSAGNQKARSAYDRLAEQTDLVTYDLGTAP
jgi:GNAT superfamily N-acetyltransferase